MSCTWGVHILLQPGCWADEPQEGGQSGQLPKVGEADCQVGLLRPCCGVAVNPHHVCGSSSGPGFGCTELFAVWPPAAAVCSLLVQLGPGDLSNNFGPPAAKTSKIQVLKGTPANLFLPTCQPSLTIQLMRIQASIAGGQAPSMARYFHVLRTSWAQAYAIWGQK